MHRQCMADKPKAAHDKAKSRRAAVIHPTFGAKLRWWRESRGLSQQGLADAAKVSKSLIEAYEKSKSNLGYQRTCWIAEALDIPVPYLWDHDPPPSPHGAARQPRSE